MQTINNNWANVLGEQTTGHGLWADFLTTFGQLTWSDYAIFLLLISFIIVGFKRGFALGLINFIWALSGVIFASIFYQMLSHNKVLWLFYERPLTSFISLFLAFLLLKIGLYKVLSSIAKIHGPCPLNRFLAICIGIVIVASMSWILADNIIYIELIQRLITQAELRIIVLFMLIFGALIITGFVLIKMLNIKVGIDQPCPLLLALKPLDSILSAKSINSPLNHFFGLWLGLFKGMIVAVLIIVALNHASYLINGLVTDEFNALAANVQTVLADYLTFIKQ